MIQPTIENNFLVSSHRLYFFFGFPTSDFSYSVHTRGSPAPLQWLISRRNDFWFACGGASLGLVAAVALVFLRGDREIDTLDFVLSEFHLGATYYTIFQRRLWQRLPGDVLIVPLVILALTYALLLSGHQTLLTSIAMYAAIWHRGRQSLGVARFYQRAAGGPTSPAHNYLFQGVVYSPMFAALLAYTHLAPLEYEGEPYFALDAGIALTAMMAIAAAGCLIAYFAWALSPMLRERWMPPHPKPAQVHPGEWWVVLAHWVAFGSGYVLGAGNASFLLVLAVHHEVQYLYFVYAMNRRRRAAEGLAFHEPCKIQDSSRPAQNDIHDYAGRRSRQNLPRETGTSLGAEFKYAAYFLAWPVLGFSGAVVGGWSGLEWLAPLGMGGLFCHYWLDGRIWTRRALSV
jgi:hypothetical protein